MIIAEMNNVTKYYEAGMHRTLALDHIHLTISSGELVTIIGRSGSGKSTLLHILGGLMDVTDGSVVINGQDITKLSKEQLTIFRRRNIGFIFQFYNLVPSLNVYENITLPIELDGLKPDKEYIEELMTRLNISDKKEQYIEELSGGEQQRVAIVRALASHPAIILCDEPTGNLDSVSAEEVLDIIKISQKKYHQTVVIATHDDAIARAGDIQIQIMDGRIHNQK